MLFLFDWFKKICLNMFKQVFFSKVFVVHCTLLYLNVVQIHIYFQN